MHISERPKSKIQNAANRNARQNQTHKHESTGCGYLAHSRKPLLGASAQAMARGRINRRNAERTRVYLDRKCKPIGALIDANTVPTSVSPPAIAVSPPAIAVRCPDAPLKDHRANVHCTRMRPCMECNDCVTNPCIIDVVFERFDNSPTKTMAVRGEIYDVNPVGGSMEIRTKSPVLLYDWRDGRPVGNVEFFRLGRGGEVSAQMAPEMLYPLVWSHATAKYTNE